mmetsp:Transcript_14876/g.47362  ORF Transcript_14876/g.47362 Transcript_14876/m.47362 type:complete len:227 (+) Transcript_14876:554-1234(+)
MESSLTAKSSTRNLEYPVATVAYLARHRSAATAWTARVCNACHSAPITTSCAVGRSPSATSLPALVQESRSVITYIALAILMGRRTSALETPVLHFSALWVVAWLCWAWRSRDRFVQSLRRCSRRMWAFLIRAFSLSSSTTSTPSPPVPASMRMANRSRTMVTTVARMMTMRTTTWCSSSREGLAPCFCWPPSPCTWPTGAKRIPSSCQALPSRSQLARPLACLAC